MDVPYAWVTVLVAAAFVFSAVANAVRFARSGAPSHAIGVMLFGFLAIISSWVAWVAVAGPPVP